MSAYKKVRSNKIDNALNRKLEKLRKSTPNPAASVYKKARNGSKMKVTNSKIQGLFNQMNKLVKPFSNVYGKVRSKK